MNPERSPSPPPWQEPLLPPLVTWLLVAAVVVLAILFWRGREGSSPDFTEAGPSGGNAEIIQDPGDLQQEAQQYVDDLAEPTGEAVDARSSSNFLSPDQPIRLGPDPQTREVLPGDLLQRPGVGEDTVFTVMREDEQIEYRTLRQLLQEHDQDRQASLRVLQDGRIEQTTLGALLDAYPGDLEAVVAVVGSSTRLETTTAGELLRSDAGKPVQVVTGSTRPAVTTVGELLAGQHSGEGIYYVHTVTGTDYQGIWGILHHGLVENFARGIAIHRGEQVERYRVQIPRHADERTLDQSSSFLGRMIDAKMQQSYVYNFDNGQMGRNPDMLQPGQEIVIVAFTPEELVRIYQHFTRLPTPAPTQGSL